MASTVQTEVASPSAFGPLLRSSVGFFALAIAAIVFGLARGRGFVVPSFQSSGAAVMTVYFVGMMFPAIAAACLLVGWVRFSVQRHREARMLARIPWVYFTVFVTMLALLLARSR